MILFFFLIGILYLGSILNLLNYILINNKDTDEEKQTTGWLVLILSVLFWPLFFIII